MKTEEVMPYAAVAYVKQFWGEDEKELQAKELQDVLLHLHAYGYSDFEFVKLGDDNNYVVGFQKGRDNDDS